MPRWLSRLIVALVLLVVTFGVLWYVELLVPLAPDKTASMSPTIRACDGRVLAEGFTYRWLRDPRRGEIVAIHATRGPGGKVEPDRDAREVVVISRVVAVPGDEIVGRDGSVFVNGLKVDDIETEPFKQIDLGGDQFYVLGDNRSAAQDSREFGPILENAIFARVLFTFWPIRDFGPVNARRAGSPPGKITCN